MTIWSAEIKELEKLNEPISGRLPANEKEMGLFCSRLAGIAKSLDCMIARLLSNT